MVHQSESDDSLDGVSLSEFYFILLITIYLLFIYSFLILIANYSL